MARYLGPDGLGLFSMVTMIAGIIALIAGLGINGAVVKYVAEYKEDKRIWAGWHGPYIQGPEGGSLKDGWGRPLIFEKGKGDLRIASYGADGEPGGSGLDEDIEIIIKRYHYMAPVGGRVNVERPGVNINEVTIHYPQKGKLKESKIKVDNGNFMSNEKELIPIGLRSIGSPSGGKPIVFSVVSTMNWLGTLE